MEFTKRFKMWGVVPVAFNQNGSWDVDIAHPVGKRVVCWATTRVLSVNAWIERFSNHTLVLTPSLVPVEAAAGAKA